MFLKIQNFQWAEMACQLFIIPDGCTYMNGPKPAHLHPKRMHILYTHALITRMHTVRMQAACMDNRTYAPESTPVHRPSSTPHPCHVCLDLVINAPSRSLIPASHPMHITFTCPYGPHIRVPDHHLRAWPLPTRHLCSPVRHSHLTCHLACATLHPTHCSGSAHADTPHPCSSSTCTLVQHPGCVTPLIRMSHTVRRPRLIMSTAHHVDSSSCHTCIVHQLC